MLMLLASPQVAAVNPYVFPGRDGKGYLVEPKHQMKKVVETSQAPFTAHDLRRTFITVAERLNISMYAIKRLVNHKFNNDVTAGYIVSDVGRLREPMQTITDHLKRAVGLNKSAEVIHLPRKAHP